ncbi:MAG: YitT family protein [Bacilli bacterium]
MQTKRKALPPKRSGQWYLKLSRNRQLVGILGMVTGTIIYCFSVVFIVDLGQFYTGGITGVAQIFANIFKIPALKSIIVAVVNIPLFIMGWKHISKRFAILSLSSVVLQVLLLAFFDWLYSKGFTPFDSIIDTITDASGNQFKIGYMTLAVIGGLGCGIGCALPLRTGSSTGGLDIVTQTWSMKTGIPFAVITSGLDLVIIICGAIVGQNISVAVYTVIRLIVHVITLDKIHTIYKYQKITIITEKEKDVQEALVNNFFHGVTIYDALGGYSNCTKYVLESVVFTYELEDYRTLIKKIDPNAFMYYTAIKGIRGKFTKRAIN